LHQRGDGVVELGEAEKHAVAKPRENPALSDEHARFYFGFRSWRRRRRWNCRHPVVLGELRECIGDVRIVAVRLLDRALELIGDEDGGGYAEVLERTNAARHEIRNTLRVRRLREGVVACPEHRDEQLDVAHFTRLAVTDPRL